MFDCKKKRQGNNMEKLLYIVGDSFELYTLLWIGSCTHCILARFPLSKKT